MAALFLCPAFYAFACIQQKSKNTKPATIDKNSAIDKMQSPDVGFPFFIYYIKDIFIYCL